MSTIDADTHVIETERTWDYLDGADAKFRPMLVAPTAPDAPDQDFWVIDGHLFPGRKSNIGLDIPAESREMADIQGRLRHMDALGVDRQVLYPTIFIFPLTSRPDVDVALCRSYNRWLADISAQAHGRLPWVVVVPWLDIPTAIEELRFARQHGACGVFMRGLEGDRRPIDPYFFPVYEEAERLDLPICFHAAAGNTTLYELFMEEAGFAKFKFPVVAAFHSLIVSEVPRLFPRLRFGFFEVRSQWVPYMLVDLAGRLKKKGRALPEDVMREYRLFVACQTDDDLPYVVKYAGEDNLLIGSDYGHADTATELEALRLLQDDGQAEPRIIGKILDDNARVFYGL
jgi:predicted TIM-barrel fold metal-dependent hydrolase